MGGPGPPVPLWYLVLTERRAESLAAHELSIAGFATVLPMILEGRRAVPARRLSRKQRLLPARCEARPVLRFPGYAFVAFDRLRDPWQRIARTPGVRRLFQSGEQSPVPLPDGVVEAFRGGGVAKPAQAAADLPIRPGALLRVEGGPLASFPGVCLWSDAMRVRMRVEILGRQTVAELLRSTVSVVG